MPLFFSGLSPLVFKVNYAVAPDGRFLVNTQSAEGTAPPITLILNWTGAPER